MVLSVFLTGKGKWGSRRVKMQLLRIYGTHMNLKKVQRIMKFLGLKAIVRRRRHLQSYFSSEIHRTLPNILKQKFKIAKPGEAYSTDITYLNYGNSQRAFLSATKDLASREIVYHSVSTKTDIALVTSGLKERILRIPPEIRSNLIIHSDQGAVYTSGSYRNLLKNLNVKQSMSRRGNCLDNAPIESFFGHLKDELEYEKCKDIDELTQEVARYIEFYNSQRPQWALKEKTPVEYRGLIN